MTWNNPDWRGLRGTDAETLRRIFLSLSQYLEGGGGGGGALNFRVADGGHPDTDFGWLWPLNCGRPNTDYVDELPVDGGGI